MSETNANISTSCRDCIFAIYDGDTQYGCEFDRIDKFENNGAEIIGQDDGEKQYFLIDGRFCNACRNHEWGKMNPRRKWGKLVQDKIEVQMDIFIDARKYGLEIPDIIKTIEGAYAQTTQPKTVFIICDPDYVFDIVNYMRSTKHPNWKVEHQSIDRTFKYGKSTYYTVFNAGYEIPSDFIEKINTALNIDMKRFVVVLPQDKAGNGRVIQQCGKSFDQLMDLAGEDSDLVKKHEEIFN